MKRLLASAVLVIVGCSSPGPIPWTEQDVAGLHIVLDDPKVVEEFSFRPTGNVSATLGMKGGPLTGPSLSWRIVEGRLTIEHESYQEELTLLSKTSERLVVLKRSGATAEYEIKP